MNKEPTFEEGPFFLVAIGAAEGIVTPQLGRRAIVWATDAPTARSVFGRESGHSIAYIYPELIGSLTDVKRDYRLTNAQIADLHRKGYLRL